MLLYKLNVSFAPFFILLLYIFHVSERSNVINVQNISSKHFKDGSISGVLIQTLYQWLKILSPVFNIFVVYVKTTASIFIWSKNKLCVAMTWRHIPFLATEIRRKYTELLLSHLNYQTVYNSSYSKYNFKHENVNEIEQMSYKHGQLSHFNILQEVDSNDR